MGSNCAPPWRTACIKTSPPTTRASLFASNSRLPALTAAIHGGKPAAPTMAAMTASTDSCEAIISSAAGPDKTCVGSWWSRIFSANKLPCGALAMTAKTGLKRRHCASIKSTCTAALRAKTSKRSGCRDNTSRVLTPIEPVEPRMVIFCVISEADQHHGQRQSGYERIQAVKHTAVPGQ